MTRAYKEKLELQARVAKLEGSWFDGREPDVWTLLLALDLTPRKTPPANASGRP